MERKLEMLTHKIRDAKEGETVRVTTVSNTEKLEKAALDRMLRDIDINGDILDIIVSVKAEIVKAYDQNDENSTETRNEAKENKNHKDRC